MRQYRLIVGLAAALLAAPAGAIDLGIVAGSPSGTYVRVAEDISGLVAAEDIALDVRESHGSLQNVFALRYTPGVQLGLVQSDILGFLRARAEGVVPEGLSPAERDELSDLTDRIKLVHPLYVEEVHILARRDVPSVEALAGRRVSFGRRGGGTFITAEQLFRLIDVEVEPFMDVAPGDAIEFMRAGEIDAMVYVVGQPVDLLAGREDLAEDFHFLPIDRPELLEVYEPATIARASYPWIDADVQTVGVRSLLAAYDYENPENCEAIRTVASAIVAGIGALRASGHPKWQAVALDAPVRQWERYRCADAVPAGGPTPVAGGGGAPSPVDVIEGFRR